MSADRVSGALTVENDNGGVQGIAVRGGADVTTSFGPVVLRQVEGRLIVRNSNGAVDVAPLASPGACHDVSVATSFGPIKVSLPGSGYALDARTSFGRVRSDLPVTASGSVGERSLSGTIGGGGCALQLTNSNGDIEILRGVAVSK